jgi:CRP-like cAMP-binding protein
MTIENKFIQYFTQFMPLSDEEAQAIVEGMRIQTFPKGTVLLREGQISMEAYFVLEGCVRQYSMHDGEEKTTNFFTEEQWVISLQSFTHKTPANHFFACCEDSMLVVGTAEESNALYKRFPRIETISRKVVEKNFMEQQELMASYITDTPEQRYLKLLQSRPNLAQRIPQYQLASYIGVKPESLSRMRKRIMAKIHPATMKKASI